MKFKIVIAGLMLSALSALAAAPKMSISSPHGGEAYVVGQPQQFVYNGKTKFKTLTVEVSKDGGLTWENIGQINNKVKDFNKRNKIVWVVNGQPSTICQVRMTGMKGSKKKAKPFSVTSGLFVIAAGLDANGNLLTGPKGTDGDQGLVGATGPVGPAGPKGDPGKDSSSTEIVEILTHSTEFLTQVKGDKGDKGDAGTNGLNGLNGLDGEDANAFEIAQLLAADSLFQISVEQILAIDQDFQDAVRGDKGDKGDTGATGAVGPAGADGAAGPAGVAGPAGADGKNGIDGAVGPAGPAGAVGADGQQGVAGPVGPAGPAGAKGDTGADGAPGVAGAQGPAGAVGPVGPAGPKGDTGADGAPGAAGAQGVAGPVGPAGAVGPQGPAGPVGPPGAQGPTGPNGSTTVSYINYTSTANAVLTSSKHDGTLVINDPNIRGPNHPQGRSQIFFSFSTPSAAGVGGVVSVSGAGLQNGQVTVIITTQNYAIKTTDYIDYHIINSN